MKKIFGNEAKLKAIETVWKMRNDWPEIRKVYFLFLFFFILYFIFLFLFFFFKSKYINKTKNNEINKINK